MALWLWSWAFSGSKIFKRRTIWISHSQRVDMTELDNSFRRDHEVPIASMRGLKWRWKTRGSGEVWYSQHFRVPDCPCRNGRAGAHQVKHLNTKTAIRKYSCCLTGSQRKSFNKGVMWSNFQARLTILQAKFCTVWSLSRLDWVVLLQTEEQ